MGRRALLLLAAFFAVLAASALGVHYLTAPTTLRLAAGPLGSEDMRMAAGFVQGFNRAKGSVRLKLVATAGLTDSASRLERGDADLAILRPDIAFPPTAQTILITRRFFPFFITRPERDIKRVRDLAGKRIGVVAQPRGNVVLLTQILRYYDLLPSLPVEEESNGREVTIVPLLAGDVAAAAQEGRIDAMFVVGGLLSRTLNQGLANLRAAWGDKPVYIPIREAEALAVRNRAIETGEIVRGAFGGDPPRPATPLPTISVTHRLVAAETLDDQLAADVARTLLNLRSTLINDVPSMQGLEVPSTAKDAALRVHPGAAAYFDGEEKTFFDRYGDLFYIGVMGLSLLASGIAAMASQASGARRRSSMKGLARIVVLISEARVAAGQEALEAIEAEADGLLAGTLERLARNEIDEQGLSAYRLAMDQLGRAVAERRRSFELGEQLAAE